MIKCVYKVKTLNEKYSPEASGFNLKKNVESWNFQESYLDAHLTPWWKAPNNSQRRKIFIQEGSFATGRLLL